MVTYFTLSGGRSLVALRSQLMDGFPKPVVAGTQLGHAGVGGATGDRSSDRDRPNQPVCVARCINRQALISTRLTGNSEWSVTARGVSYGACIDRTDLKQRIIDQGKQFVEEQ
jgi:hypothetical protein